MCFSYKIGDYGFIYEWDVVFEWLKNFVLLCLKKVWIILWKFDGGYIYLNLSLNIFYKGGCYVNVLVFCF